MSDKPPITKSGKLTVREYLWGQIRVLKIFQLNDLLNGAPRHYALNIQKVRHYLRGWENSGHLTSEFVKSEHGRRPPKKYTLKVDTGVNPPMVTVKGEPNLKGLQAEQMWRTMRMINVFTFDQIATLASTDEITISRSAAEKFCCFLCKAGYLRQVKRGHKQTGTTQYQLKPAAWTGNKPPKIVRTNVVFDQNKNQVVWPKEFEGDY